MVEEDALINPVDNEETPISNIILEASQSILMILGPILSGLFAMYLRKADEATREQIKSLLGNTKNQLSFVLKERPTNAPKTPANVVEPEEEESLIE